MHISKDTLEVNLRIGILNAILDLPPMYPGAAQRVNRPVDRASLSPNGAVTPNIPRHTSRRIVCFLSIRVP